MLAATRHTTLHGQENPEGINEGNVIPDRKRINLLLIALQLLMLYIGNLVQIVEFITPCHRVNSTNVVDRLLIRGCRVVSLRPSTFLDDFYVYCGLGWH
jgi:hypothetical protein